MTCRLYILKWCSLVSPYVGVAAITCIHFNVLYTMCHETTTNRSASKTTPNSISILLLPFIGRCAYVCVCDVVSICWCDMHFLCVFLYLWRILIDIFSPNHSVNLMMLSIYFVFYNEIRMILMKLTKSLYSVDITCLFSIFKLMHRLSFYRAILLLSMKNF